MTRRLAACAFLVALVALVAGAWPAAAALRTVAVGNFYFDDATPGDGVVEANQGDQLRFTVYDGGPGTPHTVDVDALGIHSGSLAAGETYTTGALDRPGTYTLYCKTHLNRGHTATLIVRASTATTAKPAPTTPPPAASPTTVAPGVRTTAAPATTAPAASSAKATTTTARGGGTGATSPAPAAPATTTPAGGGSGMVTTTALAPVGRGAADEEALAVRPVDPDSLQAALGRPVAARGSWTRSVRLALVALVPMLCAVAVSARRGWRLG